MLLTQTFGRKLLSWSSVYVLLRYLCRSVLGNGGFEECVVCVGGGSGLGERIYLGYKLFLSNRNG